MLQAGALARAAVQPNPGCVNVNRRQYRCSLETTSQKVLSCQNACMLLPVAAISAAARTGRFLHHFLHDGTLLQRRLPVHL
jgi:hypothetical protein